MMISCPSLSKLESRFERLLVNPEQHPDLVAHVEGCSICQARLEDLLDANERATPRRCESLPMANCLSPEPAATIVAGAQEARPGEAACRLAIPGYEVLARLGRGGMGVVYKARHLKLNRLVALKMIRSDLASREHRRRFQIEAQAVARLQHPNIVQIHEVAEHDGLPYIALELVEGGSLADHLDKEPMAPREAARMLRLLARAVAHAHERGIVHRDLKPDNVLLAAPTDEPALNKSLGCPKISDFGLARPLGEDHRVTRTGAVLGTPGYMAPEQAAGLEASTPADVYSLGVILYRMLAGRRPFDSGALSDLLYQIGHDPPPSLRGTVPGVPESLERLCLACLEKEPARRPTAHELAKRLDEILESPNGGTSPQPRRRRLLSVSVLTVVLLACGLGWALAGLSRHFAEAGVAETALPAKPLTVKALRVHHFAGEDQDPRGELGNGSSAACFGDCVTVTVELSESAYFYLIELNFEGKEQLIWPGNSKGYGSPSTVPMKQSHVYCPAGDNRIWLDEDKARSGLQVYIVAASRRPLPCYAQWKQKRGDVHWARRPPGNTVWLADPRGSFALNRGRLERSKVRPAGKGPSLDELCRAMQVEGVETVKAVAFPVLP